MPDKKEFIVIFSTVPFPYGNASDNAIYTFMDGFQEHGCEGEVVCVYPNSNPDHHIGKEGEFQGVKYKYLSRRTSDSSSKLIHLWNYWCYPFFAIRRYLKRKCRENNVSALFVTHVDRRFLIYSRICKRFGVGVTLVSCEYPMFLTKHPNSINRYNRYSRYIDKYIFETRTLADFEQKHILHPIDSLVVPATMPFDDILNSTKCPVETYIAYTGSIFSDSKDGLSNIIKAFSWFRFDFPDVKLKLIGRIANMEYYNQLVHLVESLGLEGSVSFSGEVSRSDYVNYLTNAELLIVAKPKDSYYVGGLSSKVIEYLFSGNPVLMVAADDYVEYLTHGENVYFTDDNMPDTLSQAMAVLFNNEEMRKNIGQSGKEYALSHFNYHILTKGLLHFLTK